MYIIMCLNITITIMFWVLSIYPFIKHNTIVSQSMLTIKFSHMSGVKDPDFLHSTATLWTAITHHQENNATMCLQCTRYSETCLYN